MKKYILTIAIFSAVILSACSFGSTIESELSSVMSEMHDAEKTYRDGQKDLNEIEQTEQKLFNETMELTQEENEKLKTNIAELEDLLDQRIVHIEDEEKSMNAAKDLLSDIEKVAEKSGGDAKKEIEKLKGSITHRYEMHATFVEKYKELTNLQQELYEMLINDNMDLSQLEKQVEALNAKNDEVTSAIEEFNEATVTLNQTKDATFKYFKNDKSE